MEHCYANNKNSLFRKYAYLITTLARKHDIFREFVTKESSLVVPKDVSLLLPNGYQEFDGKQGRLTVTTRPIYAPHLYPILAKIDAYAPFIRDFQEAQDMLMFLTKETKQKPSFIPYKEMPRLFAEIAFATFNPDAHPESTSVDGYLIVGAVDVTWATIKADTTADTINDSGANYVAGCGYVECSTTTNQFRYLGRGVELFDTSSLGAGFSIDTSTFSVWGKTGGLDQLSPQQSIAMVRSAPASNTGLVSADFGTFTLTRQSDTNINTGASWNTNAYLDYALNATGKGNIAKTGITKFGTAFSCDIDNSAPTWSSGQASYGGTNFAENGSNIPKLVVVSVAVAAAAGGHAYFM